MKNFDTFGVMIDMSRNAVMSVEGLKRFLTLLKKMGYNMVMLYTEDTYEVDGESSLISPLLAVIVLPLCHPFASIFSTVLSTI